jgi:hypothetical protein
MKLNKYFKSIKRVVGATIDGIMDVKAVFCIDFKDC